jgi:AraC-like DNA-binding protein
LDGEWGITINNTKYNLKRGDFLIIPRNTEFIIDQPKSTEQYIHYLAMGCESTIGAFDWVDLYQIPTYTSLETDTSFEGLQSTWLELKRLWDSFVEDFHQEMTEEYNLVTMSVNTPIQLRTSQTENYFKVKGTYYRWMAWIMESLNNRLPEIPVFKDMRVHQTCMYILENYEKNLNLNDLAKVAHISESHLRLLFQENLSLSPMNYLRQVRLDKAKEFLFLTSYTIQEISNLVGFEDTSYFSRVFRKETGMTPIEYRKQGKLGELIFH